MKEGKRPMGGLDSRKTERWSDRNLLIQLELRHTGRQKGESSRIPENNNAPSDSSEEHLFLVSLVVSGHLKPSVLHIDQWHISVCIIIRRRIQ